VHVGADPDHRQRYVVRRRRRRVHCGVHGVHGVMGVHGVHGVHGVTVQGGTTIRLGLGCDDQM
jgi:hypothetical protein